MTVQFILWAVSAFCMFPFVLFKIFCLFKKKCSWKKCPFRAKTLATVPHIKSNTDKGFRYQPLTENASENLQRIKMLNPDGEFILM